MVHKKFIIQEEEPQFISCIAGTKEKQNNTGVWVMLVVQSLTAEQWQWRLSCSGFWLIYNSYSTKPKEFTTQSCLRVTSNLRLFVWEYSYKHALQDVVASERVIFHFPFPFWMFKMSTWRYNCLMHPLSSQNG